jgi:dephospho-CoA kinase
LIRVGLTGNVASGKSEVARLWRDAGIPVVDADALAREVVAKGSPCLSEIVQTFGEGVLTSEGVLDRAKLRGIVFADPEARVRLEAVIHPQIGVLRRRWVEDREAEGTPLIVCEIPLLFETGTERDFDAVVLVHAPAVERERRLREVRGLTSVEARQVMESQGDAEAKLARADYVLHNSGTLDELRTAALDLLDVLRAEGDTPAGADRESGADRPAADGGDAE